MYDLAIIGGGPAGVAAAVYASRKRLKTVLIAKEFGGQSVVSDDIQNWVGTVSISGTDLAKVFKEHVEAYKGDIVDIEEGAFVKEVKKTDEGFVTETDKGEFKSKTVLVATGSTRRKLTVPGADQFEHRGITYCATCDGPLFTDRDVVVIGGGNAAFESAAQLLAYTKSVTLLNRGETFRADPVTVEKVLAHPNMTAITNAELKEITGEKSATGLIYTDKSTGEDKVIETGGIFVEIGLIPTTNFVQNLVELTERKQVVVDPRTQQTSIPGVWAAGDCTDGLYHQNNIAAGDAVKALEDIHNTLTTK
jgi:NADH-dependent peroxiredoxin subunit F